MKHKFTCSVCGLAKTHESDVSTGYGTDREGNKVCFACCAEQDKAYMRENGRITLYLSGNKVTNWPNTLELPTTYQRKGYHNIARTRVDVWFNFEGAKWHGTQYGDNSQLCHCKRIKG